LASTGIERKDTIYKAGAYQNFDTTNKFSLYRHSRLQVLMCSFRFRNLLLRL